MRGNQGRIWGMLYPGNVAKHLGEFHLKTRKMLRNVPRITSHFMCSSFY